MSMNKVILIGRLGKDPETKYLPDGTCVANFSIATSDRWTDKITGEKKEKTEWHRIVAWRKLGEICGEYLTKGHLISIEGKLQTRSWEKDGETKYITEIVASDMRMLTRPEGQQNQRPEPPPADKQRPPTDPYGDDPDDIPF